jgi:hypothetical protein
MEAKDSITRRESVRTLMRYIMEHRVESFEPVATDVGYSYPEAEKVLGTDSVDAASVLETLADMRVFERQLLESTLSCPNCGAFHHSLKPVCPTCSSGRLLRGNVVEHLICGYVDFESEFSKKGYRCPKCDKELKALGVDYRRAGIFYKCVSCGRVSAIPVKRYICGKCMRASIEEELVLKPGYKYVVNHEALSTLLSQFVDLAMLTNYFESRGYSAVSPAYLPGSSGIHHEFTLYVNKPGYPPSLGVVADVTRIVNEAKIYELFTKNFDVKAGSAALMVIGRVDDKIRRLAQTFSIQLFEAGSVEELFERVKKPIEDVLKQLHMRGLAKEVEILEKLLKKLEAEEASAD